MRNFVQPGDVLDLVAPAGGVVSGQGFIVGEIFAVATVDADAGDICPSQVTGVIELAKAPSQAWAIGDAVYWDAGNDRASTVATVGPKIGVVTEAVAGGAGDTAGRVRLDAVANAGSVGGGGGGSVVEATGTPTSITTAGNVTYTAAQLLSGIIVRDPAGGARTDTLPTAALLVAAIPGAEVGDTVKCYLINGADAAEAITVAAGAGGAFDAAQAEAIIPRNGRALVHLRLTDVGSGTEAYVAYV